MNNKQTTVARRLAKCVFPVEKKDLMWKEVQLKSCWAMPHKSQFLGKKNITIHNVFVHLHHFLPPNDSFRASHIPPSCIFHPPRWVEPKDHLPVVLISKKKQDKIKGKEKNCSRKLQLKLTLRRKLFAKYL